jgi:hypothetical protein
MSTKDRKIELLDRQIEAAKDVRPEDIAEWQLDTEIALRRTVGEGSPALKAFRAISFSWINFDGEDKADRLRTGVVRAIACLKSAVAELDLRDGMSNAQKTELLNRQIDAAKDGHPDDLAEWRLRTETVIRSTVGDGSRALTQFPAISDNRMSFGGEDQADLQRDSVLQAVGHLKSAISELDLLDEEPSAQLAAEEPDGDMVVRTFDDLVMDLGERRRNAEKPPVLLLGAGASIAAGVGVMDDLYKLLDCKDFEEFSSYVAQLSEAERYRYLATFLQNPRFPDEITPGYRALATLLAHTYFDLVLTTNMDPLLEDALAAARLWRRDYMVFVNGVLRPQRVKLPLLGPSPRVKIVKLHGDLFSYFMAWTRSEMDKFLSESWQLLKDAVAGRDFIVVGYSLRDKKVLDLVKSADSSVWFLHREAIPDYLKDIHKEIKYFRAVVGPECAFEKCFPAIAKAFNQPVPTTPLDTAKLELNLAGPVVAGAQTVDDLMSATFGIEGPAGDVSSTAFLIDEPRVMLCDRYATGLDAVGDAATLVDSNGNSFRTHVIAVDSSYPFGPAVLEAPTHLRAPGLRLAPGPLQLNAAVQVLVAVGAAVGISPGKVTGQGVSRPIAPIRGEISDLVELECFVAPGASGGPVVDTTLSVCGFIIAGSTDPKDPRSYAYPAEHWASFVQKSGPGDPGQVADG